MHSNSADLFRWTQRLNDVSAAARLLVAITFHFVPSRFGYLEEVLRSLADFPISLRSIVVFTNTDAPAELENIRQVFGKAGLVDGQDARLEVVPELSYPYWLPWAHKKLISRSFLAPDSPYSHFAYLEDDEQLTFENFAYFLAAREALCPFGLIPSFVRIEWSTDRACYVNTDHCAPVNLAIRPCISNGVYAFVETDNPYTGSFILDQELGREYVASRSFDRKRSRRVINWNVRERAAMGLTFENPPAPFLFRTVAPVSIDTHTIPSCAWLAHLPNNYANDPKRIPMTELFVDDFNASTEIRSSADGNHGYKFYSMKARGIESVRKLFMRLRIAAILKVKILYRIVFPRKSALH
jgi:hypothetical protein